MSTASIPMVNLRLSMTKLNKLSPLTPRRNKNRDTGHLLTRSSPPSHEVDLSDDLSSEEQVPWCELNWRRHYKIACCSMFLILAIITIIVLVVYYQTHDALEQGRKPVTFDRNGRYPFGIAPPSWTKNTLASDATSPNDAPILRNFGLDERSSQNSSSTETNGNVSSVANGNATEGFTEVASTSSRLHLTEDGKNATSENKENHREPTKEMIPTENSTSVSASFGTTVESKQQQQGPRNWSESRNTTTLDSISVQQRKFNNETNRRKPTSEMHPAEYSVFNNITSASSPSNTTVASKPQQQSPRNWPESNNTTATLDSVSNVFNDKTDSDKSDSTLLNSDILGLNSTTLSMGSSDQNLYPTANLTVLRENRISFNLNLTIYGPSSTVSPLNDLDEKSTTISKLDKNHISSEHNSTNDENQNFVTVRAFNETSPSLTVNFAILYNTEKTSTADYNEQNFTYLNLNLTKLNTENSTTFNHSWSFPNLISTTPQGFENSSNFNQSLGTESSTNFSQTFSTIQYSEQNLTYRNFDSADLNNSENRSLFNHNLTDFHSFDEYSDSLEENSSVFDNNRYLIMDLDEMSDYLDANESVIENAIDSDINFTYHEDVTNLNNNLTVGYLDKTSSAFNDNATTLLENSTKPVLHDEKATIFNRISTTNLQNAANRTIASAISERSDENAKIRLSASTVSPTNGWSPDVVNSSTLTNASAQFASTDGELYELFQKNLLN